MRTKLLLSAAAAVLLRIIFTGVVATLMELPYLKLAGGLALLFIAAKLVVPDNEGEDNDTAAKRAAPTGVLLRAGDDPVMRAELHWRLAAPLSALILTLLALPLSKSNPREPRYARLLVAVLAWWVFNTALGLGRSWISQEKLAPAFGFWWVYLPTIAIALWMIRSSQRMPRSRPARSVP